MITFNGRALSPQWPVSSCRGCPFAHRVHSEELPVAECAGTIIPQPVDLNRPRPDWCPLPVEVVPQERP